MLPCSHSSPRPTGQCLSSLKCHVGPSAPNLPSCCCLPGMLQTHNPPALVTATVTTHCPAPLDLAYISAPAVASSPSLPPIHPLKLKVDVTLPRKSSLKLHNGEGTLLCTPLGSLVKQVQTLLRLFEIIHLKLKYTNTKG